jgi:general secretion pathway protein J
MLRSDRRAGFTLLEVLAALAITAGFVATVLPYATRLATRWWVGETVVETADGWMQALARMSDDISAAIPYNLAQDGKPVIAFRSGPDFVLFLRPPLGPPRGTAFEMVSYRLRPTAGGMALIRQSGDADPRQFQRDPAGFGTATTLLEGPFRLRFAAIADDGGRKAAWTPGEAMPAAVELRMASEAGTAAPLLPARMAIAARPAPSGDRASEPNL